MHTATHSTDLLRNDRPLITHSLKSQLQTSELKPFIVEDCATLAHPPARITAIHRPSHPTQHTDTKLFGKTVKPFTLTPDQSSPQHTPSGLTFHKTVARRTFQDGQVLASTDARLRQAYQRMLQEKEQEKAVYDRRNKFGRVKSVVSKRLVDERLRVDEANKAAVIERNKREQAEMEEIVREKAAEQEKAVKKLERDRLVEEKQKKALCAERLAKEEEAKHIILVEKENAPVPIAIEKISPFKALSITALSTTQPTPSTTPKSNSIALLAPYTKSSSLSSLSSLRRPSIPPHPSLSSRVSLAKLDQNLTTLKSSSHAYLHRKRPSLASPSTNTKSPSKTSSLTSLSNKTSLKDTRILITLPVLASSSTKTQSTPLDLTPFHQHLLDSRNQYFAHRSLHQYNTDPSQTAQALQSITSLTDNLVKDLINETMDGVVGEVVESLDAYVDQLISDEFQ